jgi:hypothetical protein
MRTGPTRKRRGNIVMEKMVRNNGRIFIGEIANDSAEYKCNKCPYFLKVQFTQRVITSFL